MNTATLINFISGRSKGKVSGAITTKGHGCPCLAKGLGAPAAFQEAWLSPFMNFSEHPSNQAVPLLEITALVFASGNHEGVGIVAHSSEQIKLWNIPIIRWHPQPMDSVARAESTPTVQTLNCWLAMSRDHFLENILMVSLLPTSLHKQFWTCCLCPWWLQRAPGCRILPLLNSSGLLLGFGRGDPACSPQTPAWLTEVLCSITSPTWNGPQPGHHKGSASHKGWWQDCLTTNKYVLTVLWVCQKEGTNSLWRLTVC